MSGFLHNHRMPQTSTAASAPGNLSGREIDAIAALVDVGNHPHSFSTVMETDWFPTHDHFNHHHAQQELHASASLSPADEPYAATMGYAFPSPSVPASEAFGGPHFSLPEQSMSRHPFPPPYAHDHGASHLDDLSALSPIQTQYNSNAYQTPYPDSTASSAPSEDPVAADFDEDKRKRNQAASARFRQKKKQREQQMLQQSRGMQDKNERLESELEGLKKENTFLKRLLVEKIDNMSDDDRAMLLKTTKEVMRGKD